MRVRTRWNGRRSARAWLGLGTWTLAWAVPAVALACFHPLASESVKVGQSGQQALILYADGVEELVLRAEVKAEAPLSSLAWVVPVPTAPEHYAVADARLFRELRRWVRLRWERDPRHRPRLRSVGLTEMEDAWGEHGGLRRLPAVQVGPYQIQPVQGVGPQAVEALSRWMREQGFQAIDPASTRYYAERGWTFLAIRVQPPEGQRLPRRGALPPLRIRFRSPWIVYPLKFSTHMGRMRVRLYVLTPQPLERDALEGARRKGFHVWSARRGYLRARGPRHRIEGGIPAVLRARVRGARSASRMPASLAELVRERFGDRKLWLTVLLSERFNAPSRSRRVVYRAADWAEDLAIPEPAEGQRLQVQAADAQSARSSRRRCTEVVDPFASEDDCPSPPPTAERRQGASSKPPARSGAPPRTRRRPRSRTPERVDPWSDPGLGGGTRNRDAGTRSRRGSAPKPRRREPVRIFDPWSD